MGCGREGGSCTGFGLEKRWCLVVGYMGMSSYCLRSWRDGEKTTS